MPNGPSSCIFETAAEKPRRTGCRSTMRILGSAIASICPGFLMKALSRPICRKAPRAGRLSKRPPDDASGQHRGGRGDGRELAVGLRVAPPFALQASDGVWTGISVELWRHLAEQLGLRFRFEERTSEE